QQRGTTNRRDDPPTITVTTPAPPVTASEVVDEAAFALAHGPLAVYKVFTYYGVNQQIYGPPTPAEIATAGLFYATSAGLRVLATPDELPMPTRTIPRPPAPPRPRSFSVDKLETSVRDGKIVMVADVSLKEGQRIGLVSTLRSTNGQID